ncbi:glycyl-radical enzyme activating protein [Labilibacter sediminis]|nr:glycyl-radical enzyme activating protein [Labilibacter sediminis]
MEGKIFDIKRFALNDGPGIRTTVFFKGCPLKCSWCHNPESISTKIEEFEQVRELGGQRFSSIQTIGKIISSDSLLSELSKDEQFFQQSEGGITFSGGEPMLQVEFLSDIITKCKNKNYNVVIDTAGFCKQADFDHILDQVDLFLYDIKIIDEKKHMDYTGVSNSVVLRNLEFILDKGANVIIRVPIIPDINNEDQDLKLLEEYLIDKKDRIREIHFLPFHNAAESKYKRFNKDYDLNGIKSQNPQELIDIKERFESKGFNVMIGGL